MQTLIPAVVLAVVLIAISARNLINTKLKIWHIMLFGALAVLASGCISPAGAVCAVNWHTIFYLFGVFVIGEAAFLSGILPRIADRFFSGPADARFYLLFIFASGLLAAFLLNDTIAVIGTLFALTLAADRHIRPKALLLALAFAITAGCSFSPLGSPQSLLTAQSMIENGCGVFWTFGLYLLIPAIISLLIIYPVMKAVSPGLFFPPDTACSAETSTSSASPASSASHASSASGAPHEDESLIRIMKYVIAVFCGLICINIVLSAAGIMDNIILTAAAVLPALILLTVSKRRIEILKGIDWGTLVFFIAMFILMQSVWDSGILQDYFSAGTAGGALLNSPAGIFAAGVIVSQFVSNVPFVALFIPLLEAAGASPLSYAALAGGSTIAGSLLIFGAASNLIIIQNAEEKGVRIGFLEFAKIGIPATIIQTIVFLAWFAAVGMIL